MGQSLDGKVALITGGGDGLGKAMAEEFASAGARVIVNDIRDVGAEVADDLGGVFGTEDYCCCPPPPTLTHSGRVNLEGEESILVRYVGFIFKDGRNRCSVCVKIHLRLTDRLAVRHDPA